MTLSQYVSNKNYFTSMKDWKKQHKDSLDFYICSRSDLKEMYYPMQQQLGFVNLLWLKC